MQRLLTAAILALVFASPASADAIDCEWCSPKGLHLKITGPDIVIPSGATIKGEYGRHHFAYAVPAGEPELWRRCEVTS